MEMILCFQHELISHTAGVQLTVAMVEVAVYVVVVVVEVAQYTINLNTM